MSRLGANLMLLLAALLWGAGNVAQKTVLNDLGTLTVVGLRCFIGALIIAPLLVGQRGKHKKPIDSDGAYWAIVAIASFAAAIIMQQWSYQHTTVTNAGFLVNTCTVMTPLLTRFVLGRTASQSIYAAAIMTCLGAGLMSGGSLQSMNVGDAGCIASALFYSIWMIAVGEFVMRQGREVLLTLGQFAVAGVVCLGLGLLLEPISVVRLVNAAPELCMLGVFSTGISYLLMVSAQKYASASEAAVIASGESIFGAIAAYLMLGEFLTLQGVVGAVLIGAGILAVQFPMAAQVSRRGAALAPFESKHDSSPVLIPAAPSKQAGGYR